MAKIIPITEHFQHFVKELKESFWGDLQGEAQRAAKKFFELLSERQRDRYMVDRRYGRWSARQDHRNGYYLRDFVTRFGTLRLRIARSRERGFLPRSSGSFNGEPTRSACSSGKRFCAGSRRGKSDEWWAC